MEPFQNLETRDILSNLNFKGNGNALEICQFHAMIGRYKSYEISREVEIFRLKFEIR